MSASSGRTMILLPANEKREKRPKGRRRIDKRKILRRKYHKSSRVFVSIEKLSFIHLGACLVTEFPRHIKHMNGKEWKGTESSIKLIHLIFYSRIFLKLLALSKNHHFIYNSRDSNKQRQSFRWLCVCEDNASGRANKVMADPSLELLTIKRFDLCIHCCC